VSRSEATLAQMFWNRVEASAPLPAQMVKHDGEWRTRTWAEVGDTARVPARPHWGVATPARPGRGSPGTP
jgi:long-subunit acyl-CoA synthetase (AMP-forming)